MEVVVRKLQLAELDGLASVDLLLFVGRDDRPLPGLPGLVDWRMCGALSRIVKKDLFAGTFAEALLTVPAPFLPASRVFLQGLGSLGEEGVVLDAIAEGLHAVKKAGGKRVATSPPRPGRRVLDELVSVGRDAGLQQLTILTSDPRAAEEAAR